MSEQLNQIWEILSTVLQREAFKEVNITTKKEDDKILLELKDKKHRFWTLLTFYVSESDIATTKCAIYTDLPLVGGVETLINVDEEYILGTDEFAISTAILVALNLMKQLAFSYQEEEQFVLVGSTCGDADSYNEITYIDTVKKLLPLVSGLNKILFINGEDNVQVFIEINHMFFNGKCYYDKEPNTLENAVVKLLDETAAITGIHLDIHDALEVLFKDRFADMDVDWLHQNHLVAEETSDEQSLFFEVLEEEENKSYSFEITMEIGDNIRHTQSQSITFLKQNLGTNIMLLKSCFETLRGIYIQTEARHFDRLGFVKDIADKIYERFTEEEKQTYLIKPPVWQQQGDIFHSPLERQMPFSTGLHVSFSPVPTQFGVEVKVNASERFGLFRSFSKEETYIEDAKAFILSAMEVFNPQKLAEVSERHGLPIFINHKPTSQEYILRHPGLMSANILGTHDAFRCLFKVNGSHHESIIIPIHIKAGVCVADKIDEILAVLKTRQALFEELRTLGVSHESIKSVV